MPLVTAIEPQKKRPNRFNIYLDGQFAFGVDEIVFAKNRLEINQNLTNEQIEGIIKETGLSKLIDLSLKFLSYRPRSEKEVIDYLVKKISQSEGLKYNQAKESPLITKVITKLKNYNYLDDKEFAEWWLESRLRSKPKGVNLIKAELFRKGVSREIIEKSLGNPINQIDLAKKAVEKKLRRWQNLPPQEVKKKFYSFLLTRGFDLETTKEVFASLTKKR